MPLQTGNALSSHLHAQEPCAGTSRAGPEDMARAQTALIQNELGKMKRKTKNHGSEFWKELPIMLNDVA